MADDKEKQDQDSLKAVQAQNESAKELLSTYEKLKKTKGSLKEEDQAILDISKQLVKYSSTLEKSIQARLDKSSTSKQLSQLAVELERQYNENLKNSANTVANLNKSKREYAAKARQALNEEKSIQAKINSTLAEQDVLEDKILNLRGKKGAKAKADLALAREDLRSSKAAYDILNKKIIAATKEKELYTSFVASTNEVKKNHETTLKFQEQEIGKLKEAAKEKAGQEFIDKALNSSLANRIKSAFSLSSIFSFLLDAAFKIDKQTTEMSKSLGVSKEYTTNMRNDMKAYADASSDGFINVQRLYQAQQGLTEQMGIAVDFSNEERETFARLTEITGLTADEAGRLANNAAAAGKEYDKYVSDLRVGAMEAMHANRIHISDKQILQDVSKLSAGILVKFQNNPKAIAEAVVQARKLGLSLEQVNKTGDSLLNWESSIENELEAELITGKKLNLERARAAALTGDQVTLMQEINSQVGTLADFQNMNVIAQQSLAQAFGMNRDEMADMLMKQEAINKYGDKAADMNKEQLDYMKRHNMNADEYTKMIENQRNTQEKFSDLMIKVQETIAQIAAGPLGTMLNIITSLLEKAWVMKGILVVIGAIIGGQLVGGIFSFVKGLISAIPKMLALGTATETQAVAAVTAAEAETLGIATFAIIGGIAAIMAAMSSNSSKAMKDGVMGPSGKVLFSGKEGAIKLNDNDTVIAGTNLGGGVKKQQPSSSPGMAAMGAMASAIDRLAASSNKPAVAYINGRDAFADDMGRNNSLGTSQMQNSYKFA